MDKNMTKKILLNIKEINNKISDLQRDINELLEISKIKNTNKITEKISDLENYKNPKKYNLLGNYTIKTKTCPQVYYSFCAFNSINNIIYLIYIVNDTSIVFYDLVDKKKIIEIKNAHKESIYTLKHFLDNINRRDLLLSMSYEKSIANIKIWDINKFECIFYYNNKEVYKQLDACLLNHITGNYVVITNECGEILVYNFNRFLVKKIESNERNYFVYPYYDNIEIESYIIIGSEYSVSSYYFDSNLLYHKYKDGLEVKDLFVNEKKIHNLIMNDKQEIKKLIESDSYDIRIWNFHSGILLKKISINEINITSISLWNNDFLFIGSKNKILLINLQYAMVVDELLGHNEVICIQKIIHPKLGECLISQGNGNDFIFLRSIE